MGSNLYIADERQLPDKVLRRLKQERGFDPDEPHERENPIDYLFLVGKRHAPNPALDGKFPEELTDAAKAARKERPHFTLAMSPGVFHSIDGDVQLYSTGAPDIATMADLREYMHAPGHRVALMPNRDI